MRPLGVVDIVYGFGLDAPARSALARTDGFDHIDVLVDVDPGALELPIGCPTAFPRPIAGRCATPAPAGGPGAWDRCVDWFRAAPGALLEPWAGAVVNSAEACTEMMAAVPGLRLLVDTGHVADWGGDPLELLEFAGHVQLRQGAPGFTQLYVDDPDGVVDFGAILTRLDALESTATLSIEYFDLPALGWPLPDPRAWACDLADHIRSLG